MLGAMSETEARASDDATPDDSHVSAAASHEDQAREDDASEDAPADGPAEDPSDEAPEDPSDEAPEDDPDDAEDGPEPSWWHRSHPTFAGLVGLLHRRRLRDRRARCVRRPAGAAAQ